MEVYKIDIHSWTSSFRYPNLISGVQPTLEVPPLSTILGLINAAAGTYQVYKTLCIGFYFEFKIKDTDLETIYQMDSNRRDSKSNVIRREFLYDNFLRLYITDKRIANYFKKPHFPLLLGRMNDLANVSLRSIEKITLPEIHNPTKMAGQIVPFKGNFLPGIVQALPVYFTDSIPRRNIGTAPYSVISHYNPVSFKGKAYRDIINDKEVDIYFHEIDFESYG